MAIKELTKFVSKHYHRWLSRLVHISVLLLMIVGVAMIAPPGGSFILTASAIVMWPPHSHEGYPNQSTASYSYTYALHIQRELNYLDGKIAGFDITSLAEDGVYGTNVRNAVNAYQTARNLQVDGVVGNQTWSHMEYDVFQTWPTFRHPLSIGLRYPIYSSCRKITNSSGLGLDIFIPVRTQAEWDSFRAHLPSGVTDAAGNCNVSGGGGGGGDGGDPDGGTGGWTSGTCAVMSQQCCPSECINLYGSGVCTGSIC